MNGKSVRWIAAGKRPEAARPTRPVPAPSSRILGRLGLVAPGLWRWRVIEGKCRGSSTASLFARR